MAQSCWALSTGTTSSIKFTTKKLNTNVLKHFSKPNFQLRPTQVRCFWKDNIQNTDFLLLLSPQIWQRAKNNNTSAPTSFILVISFVFLPASSEFSSPIGITVFFSSSQTVSNKLSREWRTNEKHFKTESIFDDRNEKLFTQSNSWIICVFVSSLFAF